MELKEKKNIFLEIAWKHGILLAGYVVLAFVLIAIVIKGNDTIAGATDMAMAGEKVEFGEFLFPLAIMIVLGTIVSFVKSLCGSTYSAVVQRDVRSSLGEHLLDLPFAYYDEKGSGSILNKLSSDIAAVGNFFAEILPDILVNLITVITVTVYLVHMDVMLIIVFFGCYPVMMVVADKLAKRLSAIAKKRRTRLDDRSQAVYDVIQGMTVGRSYNLYEIMKKRVDTIIDDVAEQGCKSTRISSMSWVLRNVLTTFPVVVCYLFALYEVIRGQITAGDMLAFTVLLGRIRHPLGGIVFCVNDIRESGVSFKRLQEIANTPAEQSAFGTYQPGEKEWQEMIGGIWEKEHDREVITWKNVYFSYNKNEKESQQVLKGVNLSIHQGEKVAFVGGSGEGKSTIFRILCGYYGKDGGDYQLFSHCFEDWKLEAARDCFSLVSQNVFLLPKSIWENVACARANVSREDVIEACKNANIHNFISSLPEGYDTIVGERGARLSGGERQRVSIARAFLKDAPIILLDEPTAAVDVETEKEIQEAMERIAKGKTVITIAHRLSTIKYSDRIFVLQGGVIAESGIHEELIKKDGIYGKLYSKEVAEDGTEDINP